MSRPIGWGDKRCTHTGQRCRVHYGTYADNGRVSMTLYPDPIPDDDPSPWTRATVNMPEVELPDGHALIKTWSENEGLLEALVSAGIVEATGRSVPAGYAYAAVVKLLE